MTYPQLSVEGEIGPYEEEVQADGTVRFYQKLWVGGRDEFGEYIRVLEGPAEGEKAYV